MCPMALALQGPGAHGGPVTDWTAAGAVISELDREVCLQLLDEARFGRVVLSVDCLPVALPVNFAMMGSDVVFATGPGAMFDAASRGDVLSVQADGIEPIYHTGWSVLVTGQAQVIV